MSEADDFYQAITPPVSSADERNVMRQALAGMLCDQAVSSHYYFDLDRWLAEHGTHPFNPTMPRAGGRNREWVDFERD